jgi:hypothetical protein
MAQPGRPPQRVRVALLAVCFVAVSAAAAVHSASGCASEREPGCALCATLAPALPVVAATALAPLLLDAGAVAGPAGRAAEFPLLEGGVSRAPPSITAFPSPCTLSSLALTPLDHGNRRPLGA